AAACRRPRANPVMDATHPVARAAPPGTLSQPTEGTSMYQLTGVTKAYKKGRDTVEALRGVDLTIEDREWLAIQGPTGHGKSRVLMVVGGSLKHTTGRG